MVALILSEATTTMVAAMVGDAVVVSIFFTTMTTTLVKWCSWVWDLTHEWVSDWLRLGLRHLWWLRVRPEGGGCEPIQLWCEMRSERVVAMRILDELLGFERAKVWKTKKGKMERKALLWWVRTVWSVGHSRGRGSEREGRCRGSFRGFFHLFEMETK